MAAEALPQGGRDGGEGSGQRSTRQAPAGQAGEGWYGGDGVTTSVSRRPGLMGASSRSRRSRRRRGRPSSTAPASRRGTVLLNGNEVAAAGVLVGFVLLLVGIALLTSDGTGEGGATTSPGGGAVTSDGGTTASPAAATSPGDAGTGAVPPAMNDEEAIQSTSRGS